MKTLNIGSLYRYKVPREDSNKTWIYHGVEQYGIEVRPYEQLFVVLEVSDSEYELKSVKVLSDDGKIGRLYMNPPDWEEMV